MRIAFLTYGFGHGSIGKYTWYLANNLRKFGIHVDVFTPNFHIKSVGPFLFYTKNIFLRLKNYDIVHSNEAAGVFVRHPRMVETYHHDYTQLDDFRYTFFNGLEIFQCHKVQHIIVPSFKTKSALLRFGFSSNKISVIHHGVDYKIFKKKEASRIRVRREYGLSNRFVVMNVGQLIRRKRQVDIINAIHGISGVALILVGKGEEENNIRALARKKGVKLFHFKSVSENLLADLYNASDVYVHTSTLEGFGLTVLESMACGLPVIAYKVADFEQIIDKSGIILEPRDINGVRDAVCFLKENPVTRMKLGEMARKRSMIYTWEESAKEHLNIYRHMVNGP